MNSTVRYHSRNFTAWVVTSLLVLCTGNGKIFAQESEQTVFQIRHAINVESFIILRPKVDGKESFPYYDLESATYGRKHPKALKDAGFDAVRLAIEPVPLLSISEAERRKVYAIFDEALHDFLAVGLKVVFDLHMTYRDPTWNPDALTTSTQDDKFKRYLEVISTTGRFLATYDPRLVAFELFNEPPCTGEERWAQIQQMMYTVARNVLPNHTLILTGPCLSSIDGLQKIHAGDYDNNTIFTFHFYQPSVFTHQGIPWIDDLKFIHRLPYPPSKFQADESIAAMENEVDAAADLNAITKYRIKHANRNAILKYFSIPMDRNWIQMQIDNALRWGVQMNVPARRIFVGEFGVNRDYNQKITVAKEDRLRWLEDVRTSFSKAGFPWSVWSDCCTFGIINDRTGPLDPAALKALGLTQ